MKTRILLATFISTLICNIAPASSKSLHNFAKEMQAINSAQAKKMIPPAPKRSHRQSPKSHTYTPTSKLTNLKSRALSARQKTCKNPLPPHRERLYA